MDINEFITELETVCECPDDGYMKCLEKIKELKKELEEARSSETYFKCWVSYADPDRDMLPDKEHIDRFAEEDETLKNQLYQDFDIDSDDDEPIIPESTDIGGIDVD